MNPEKILARLGDVCEEERPYVRRLIAKKLDEFGGGTR